MHAPNLHPLSTFNRGWLHFDSRIVAAFFHTNLFPALPSLHFHLRWRKHRGWNRCYLKLLDSERQKFATAVKEAACDCFTIQHVKESSGRPAHAMCPARMTFFTEDRRCKKKNIIRGSFCSFVYRELQIFWFQLRQACFTLFKYKTNRELIVQLNQQFHLSNFCLLRFYCSGKKHLHAHFMWALKCSFSWIFVYYLNVTHCKHCWRTCFAIHSFTFHLSKTVHLPLA